MKYRHYCFSFIFPTKGKESFNRNESHNCWLFRYHFSSCPCFLKYFELTVSTEHYCLCTAIKGLCALFCHLAYWVGELFPMGSCSLDSLEWLKLASRLGIEQSFFFLRDREIRAWLGMNPAQQIQISYCLGNFIVLERWFAPLF